MNRWHLAILASVVVISACGKNAEPTVASTPAAPASTINPETAKPAPNAASVAEQDKGPAAKAPEAIAATALPAASPEAMAQAKNCLTCHKLDIKVVGPAYRDVARKYRGDPNAADRLAKKVISGGSGTWGAVPMPPNTHVTPAEAKILVDWILGQKG